MLKWTCFIQTSTKRGVIGYNNFASWIIVDMSSLMLMRLPELCKSCRASCYFILLFRPSRGAEYCDQFVCLCVHLYICLSASISLEPLHRSSRNLLCRIMQIPCGCRLILFWRRCDTLCTSGFMDDVTFGRSGSYGDAWPYSGVAIPGWSLMQIVWCLWKSCLILLQMGEPVKLGI